MKTIKIIILAVMMTIATSASAMSYSEARDEALFLADKMAYELNLTDEQYEAAYEINLDYLLNVNNYADAYGVYWRIRNNSLAAILADWQYSLYEAAAYFYRPLAWIDNVLNLSIYSRYTNHRKFYRSRPAVYVTYRGGHSQNYYTSRKWNKPVRKVSGKASALPQRVQSTTASRSWNNSVRRSSVNNVNRSWTASAQRKQTTQSARNRSIQSQKQQAQSSLSQARIANKGKAATVSFGNGQRNVSNNNKMLAQNTKRNSRSFNR